MILETLVKAVAVNKTEKKEQDQFHQMGDYDSPHHF